MLTEAQLAARAGRVTASFIPYLMEGNQARIYDKWRELIGDPGWKHSSDIDPWLAYYGSAIETILLDWREQKTGQLITRRGEVVIHPRKPWAACTLDGFSVDEQLVVEVKTAHRWRKLEDIIPHYTWQVLFEIGVTGAERGILYISDGGLEPKEYEVQRDRDAELLMWSRAEAFNHNVETLSAPFDMPAVAAPVKAERIADMQGNNRWAEQAHEWLQHIDGKRRAESAEKELKSLVPADVARAFGYGIEIKRDAANRMSLREART